MATCHEGADGLHRTPGYGEHFSLAGQEAREIKEKGHPTAEQLADGIVFQK